MNNSIYQRKRDFTVIGVVGVCATTVDGFIKEAFNMPTTPVSATIDLVGIPAIVAAKENPRLAEMYNAATMAAIDGMPIVSMARRRGILCERCSGPDIMGGMFKESVRQGKTHFFYGGKDEHVLALMRENLERDFPGIRIVGMYSPPFRSLTEEEDSKVCDMINDVSPDFLWVGIGAPKQEMWMWQHQEKIHGTVMLGVGAGFDYVAGTLDKMPHWMEQHSLGWFYRLIKEPRRLWRRYILGGAKWIYYRVDARIKEIDKD